MANEPEKPIEKLLRATAAKRRADADAGPPLELHPATRRLLQGEVGRTFKSGQSTASPSRLEALRRLWPRFALSLGLLMALAIAAVVFLPGSKPTPGGSGVELAKDMSKAEMDLDKRSVAKKLEPTVADSVQSPPAVVNGADANRGVAQAGRLEPQPESLPAKEEAAATVAGAEPSPARSDAAALSLSTAENKTRTAEAPASAQTESASRQIAPQTPHEQEKSYAAAPAPAPSKPASVAAPAGQGGNEALAAGGKNSFKRAVPAAGSPLADNSDRFKNTKASANNSKAQVVLTSFDLEQSGQEVRIRDADGSVYTGSVETATEPLLKDSAKLKSPKDAPQKFGASDLAKTKAADQGGESLQNLSFSVSGLNRSLNQSLVFKGQLIGTNGTNLANNALKNQSQQFRNVQMPGQAPTLQNNAQGVSNNLRISGRAQIGAEEEFDVEAVPVGP